MKERRSVDGFMLWVVGDVGWGVWFALRSVLVLPRNDTVLSVAASTLGGDHGLDMGMDISSDDEMKEEDDGTMGGKRRRRRRRSVGEDREMVQDDAWTVISSYFEEKGLVRQQLDSFNEFLNVSLQDIVEEAADVEVLFLLFARSFAQPYDGHVTWFPGVYGGEAAGGTGGCCQARDRVRSGLPHATR